MSESDTTGEVQDMTAAHHRPADGEAQPRIGWFKRYGLGLFASTVLAVYGVVALLQHHRGGAARAVEPGARLHPVAIGWYALAVAAFLTGRFFFWPSRRFRHYVAGLGLGVAVMCYGLLALVTRHAFLPGLIGGNSTVSGSRGTGLALAYMSGGLYLVLRLFAQPRAKSAPAAGLLHHAQNAVLLVLIGSLLYVLWQVGAVG